MKVINNFRLTNSQGELLSQADVDFVNLHIDFDNELFFDFNKILLERSGIGLEMNQYISTFMHNLSQNVLFNNQSELSRLLKGLHETNATCLGMSKGRPDGNSVGKILKDHIQANLSNYQDLIHQGNFDINTVYFGISNIGPDRISDIVTSIVGGALINFTQEQCIKHSIPMSRFLLKNIYNKNTNLWENKFYELPSFDGKPFIMIPKKFISSYTGMSGTFNKFINLGFLLYFKQSEKYNALMKKSNSENALMKKEFNEFNKENHIGKKDISNIMFKEIENRRLVEIIQSLRSSLHYLSDEDIDDLLEIQAVV